MKRKILVRVMAAACLIGNIMSPGLASAHGVWVAQRAGEWAIVLGEGAVDDSYRPDAVKQVLGQRRDGSPATVGVRPKERNVVLEPDAETVAVAVSFEDGYWSQKPDGQWVAGPRTQVREARRAGYYQMFSRTILTRGAVPSRPFGLPLEILPLTDPLTLRKGAKLPVLVLFQGRPLAGAKLSSDYLNDGADHTVRTDANGRAVVKVRSSGLNVIKVSHAVSREHRTEADEDGYAATLAFALPQPKD